MGQIIRTNTQLFCHLLCRQFPGDIIVDILQKFLRDIQIRRLVLFDHWNIFIHIRQQCHQKSLCPAEMAAVPYADQYLPECPVPSVRNG